ncbi:hypothetical protein GCM10023196_076350 [Actinoallomurus vinaceus]|uniref:Uncharacterized protein n=1 Tax=Actinoallomurus vinaceus TaxID=1080074 RepID=A0ABP8UQC0_9ACTN
MLGLRLPGEHKVHWYHATSKRRRLLVDVVASLSVLHVVVVRRGMPGEPSERRRRKCLEVLLFELVSAGVNESPGLRGSARQAVREARGVGAGRLCHAVHGL